MNCPHCNHDITKTELLTAATPEDVRSIVAANASRKRTEGERKGGRPRVTARCPCGLYSEALAQRRGHVCQAG